MPFQFPPLMPTVRVVLIALVAGYAIEALVSAATGFSLFELLALQPTLDVALAWRWGTYVLVDVPSGQRVFGFVIGLLFLHLMGSPMEARIGRTHLLGLFAASTVAGAVAFLLASLILPVSFLCGARPLLWGTMGMFTYLMRHVREVRGTLLIVPLPGMSPWALIGVFVAMEAVAALLDRDASGLVSGVGAVAAGYAYGSWLDRPAAPKKPAPKPRRGGGGGLRVIQGGGQGSDDEPPRYLN